MENLQELFNEHGFGIARMISGSKSGYRNAHPDNLVCFNANIFVLGEGKVWFGDLDITLDEGELKKVAEGLGKDLYVLREMDGRFGNEELQDEKIAELAVAKISK
jgi:hypothetical protein